MVQKGQCVLDQQVRQDMLTYNLTKVCIDRSLLNNIVTNPKGLTTGFLESKRSGENWRREIHWRVKLEEINKHIKRDQATTNV